VDVEAENSLEERKIDREWITLQTSYEAVPVIRSYRLA